MQQDLVGVNLAPLNQLQALRPDFCDHSQKFAWNYPGVSTQINPLNHLILAALLPTPPAIITSFHWIPPAEKCWGFVQGFIFLRCCFVL